MFCWTARILCSILAVVTIALIATAQPSVSITKGKYHSVEIKRFDVEADTKIPSNQLTAFMLEIADEFYKLRKFDEIIEADSRKAPTHSPRLRLEGTVGKYFALVPEKDLVDSFGLWNHVEVKVRFIDAADEKVLVEKTISRRIILGALTFDRRDVTRKAAKEIAKIAKKSFF